MIALILRLVLIAASLAGFSIVIIASQTGQLVTPVRVGLYGVLPALIAVFLLLPSLFYPKQQMLALVCGLAVVAGLISAELYLQIERSGYELSIPVLKGDEPELENVKLERFHSGGHVCPNTLLSFGEGRSPVELHGKFVLPLAGLPDQPFPAIDGEPAPWPSDRHGFNNPDYVWDADATVLAIGDSFTAGGDVPIGKGFVDHVRNRFYGTVNLGCGGNGPIAELATLAEYGPVIKPEIIVWGYYEGNDLTKDILREAASDLVNYLEPSYRQDLPKIGNDLFKSFAVVLEQMSIAASDKVNQVGSNRTLDSVSLRSTLTLTQLRTALGLSLRTGKTALSLLEEVLQGVKFHAEHMGSRVLFVYIPAETRYFNPLAKLDANAFKSEVLGRVQAAGFETLDGDIVIGSARKPRRLYRGHFTSEGYRIFGFAVADKIESMLAGTACDSNLEDEKCAAASNSKQGEKSWTSVTRNTAKLSNELLLD